MGASVGVSFGFCALRTYTHLGPLVNPLTPDLGAYSSTYNLANPMLRNNASGPEIGLPGYISAAIQ